MNTVLDAGAFIAIDRGGRDAAAIVVLGRRTGLPITVAPVLTQVWRDGARQARLARFLTTVDVHTVDETASRRAGELLARAGTSDAVDALVVAAARPGDTVVTSDPHDIGRLVEARGGDLRVVVV